MSKNETDKSVFAVLLFFGLIVFLDIGSSEVQPWDEGLYAARARSVLYFDAFWDQTEYAVGGLYSSTYPPLFVWLMSGSMLLFGETTFAIRLVSALSSLFSVFLLYAIVRRILKKDFALMSALLLSGTLCWNTYARQGQTDVFLIMLFLGAFWSILNADESGSSKKKYIFTFLFYLFFAAALMTKIVISMLPLMFVIIYLIFGRRRELKFFFVFASLLAIMTAYPWYWMMLEKYGSEFYGALFVPHLYSVVENNTPWLGVFYYLNQIITSNPFLLFSFVFLLMGLILIWTKRKKIPDFIEKLDNRKLIVLIISAIWFTAGFAIFSLSVTKLHHYTNYLIPPAIILALYALENSDKFFKSKRILWLLTLVLISWTMWAFLGDLRQGAKTLGSPAETPWIVWISLGLPAAGILFLLLPIDKLNKIISLVQKNLILTIFALLIIRVVAINSLLPNGAAYGARDTSFLIYHLSEGSFTYMYHEHTEAEQINPQLDWYLMGWMTGWQKNKLYHPISLPEKSLNLLFVSKHNLLPNQILVYHKSRNPHLAEIIVEEIRESRVIIFETKSYVVFGIVKRSSSQGVPV